MQQHRPPHKSSELCESSCDSPQGRTGILGKSLNSVSSCSGCGSTCLLKGGLSCVGSKCASSGLTCTGVGSCSGCASSRLTCVTGVDSCSRCGSSWLACVTGVGSCSACASSWLTCTWLGGVCSGVQQKPLHLWGGILHQKLSERWLGWCGCNNVRKEVPPTHSTAAKSSWDGTVVLDTLCWPLADRPHHKRVHMGYAR